MNNSNVISGDQYSSFALSVDRRRRNAQRQPRDVSGRWVGAGANVKWMSHGTNWAGTVKSIKNGKAQVEVRNSDGTISNTTLDVDSLKVTTSKARIPSTKNTISDNGKGFKESFAESLERIKTDGGIIINDIDGYSAQARVRKISGSDIIYQLFAPGGQSLGETNSPESLDAMKEDHKNGPGTLFTGSENKPQEDPMIAGAVRRVSRDGSEIIVESSGEFKQVSLEFGNVISVSSKISSLTASGAWRKALPEDSTLVEKAIVAAATPLNDLVLISEESPKAYRVPKAVKDEIAYALQTGEWAEEDSLVASALVGEEPVTMAEVQWVSDFFNDYKPTEQLHGGYKGQKWAEKIISDPEEDAIDTEKYNLTDALSYYGLGLFTDQPLIDRIIAVDFIHGHVYFWGETGFELSEDTVIDSIDSPMVLPLDVETAKAVVMWIDSRQAGPLDVRDLNWEERNLFDMAEGELDYEELGDLSNAVLAAGSDEYTPQERSANAKRQRRGPGGKFGESPDAPKTKGLTSSAKARIDPSLPIVVNPWETIMEWVNSAEHEKAVSAAIAPAEEITPEAEPAPTEEAEPTQESSTNAESLYFAIVDAVDKTAVLDVIAITKKDGQPQVWKRSTGEWVSDPDISVALQGAAPPALVKLEQPEPATGVISQVDEYDSEAVVAAAYSDEQRSNDSKKGLALRDGSYPIRDVTDLKNAVKAFGRAKESDRAAVKRHIKKRAKALNRMDIVPKDWREASISEVGERLAETSPLYGEFGEVLVAGGVPGIADTPSDWAAVNRLKRYWAFGAGMAKWRPGTPGDLTRLSHHLAKYVGPDNAWGLAQVIHKMHFGEYNATRDK